MQRLRILQDRAATLWRGGPRGKFIVGCGGLAALAGLCLCSLLAWAQTPAGRAGVATTNAVQTATRLALALQAPTPIASPRPPTSSPSAPPPRATAVSTATPTARPSATTAPPTAPPAAQLTAIPATAAPATDTQPSATAVPPTAVPPTPIPPTRVPPTAVPPTAVPSAARPVQVQPTQPPPPPTQAAPTGASFTISVSNQGAGLETVTVTNRGSEAQAMGGWRILSHSSQCVLQQDQTFTFPAGFNLAAAGSVNVYSAYKNNPPADGLRARSDNIWDNDSDRAELVKPDGTVVARYGYGRCR